MIVATHKVLSYYTKALQRNIYQALRVVSLSIELKPHALLDYTLAAVILM